ncbi:hypothetical protein X770_23565 [Mesorhizobium sp. LSJC269B00]|uniref:hypothetical protein n=1 Tax=Mesorhizobium sp. LSJC269B00 TaxID=1287326 RepID=UPI0003CF7B01|nr:hypothetical protein [Mesorhizobium sp. LSJC269B00]ESW85035.1 hypothetical protein X770_23565 [Mesorhizobium sp. LSJC269B00]
MKWAEYVARRGDRVFDRVGVALDTAADRLAVQGALPRWIANAWTQEQDLGISRHGFDDGQACLCCMYMQTGKSKDEHQLVAEELGMPEAHEEVKTLLQTNTGVPNEFVARVATAMARLSRSPRLLASPSVPFISRLSAAAWCSSLAMEVVSFEPWFRWPFNQRLPGSCLPQTWSSIVRVFR